MLHYHGDCYDYILVHSDLVTTIKDTRVTQPLLKALRKIQV